MARGDQIYTMRRVMGVPYQHHGIDCGDGTVIHYRKVGTATVSRTSREAFSRDSLIYIYQQPTSYTSKVVIDRAVSRLGEQRYSLFFNNCEHFANWCKTGESVSPQLTGLRLDQAVIPADRQVADLFKSALQNLELAANSLLPDYTEARADSRKWQQVAQLALERDREDLARAALFKRRAARQKSQRLRQQLQEVSDLQIAIETDQSNALAILSGALSG